MASDYFMRFSQSRFAKFLISSQNIVDCTYLHGISVCKEDKSEVNELRLCRRHDLLSKLTAITVIGAV